MKRKITSLTTAIIVLFLMLITFPNTSWGQEKTDYEWILTDFEDLTTSDIFVIVGTKSTTNYVLAANGSNNPNATSISIVNNKITSTVESSYQWKLATTNNSGQYYITTNTNSPSYLYNKKSKGNFSTGLAATGSSSSAGNVFTYEEYTNTSTSAKTNMLKVVESSRYVCIYSTDWRAYTSGTNTDDNQTPTTFYKRQVASSDPTVTVSPTSLSGFSYVYGEGPSTQEKTISVSGSNLSTNNLVVSASSNYEVCKTINGEYSTSVEFEPTTGTVSASTVYVRLKAGLSAGSYNSADDKLTISSSGATSQTVALSGTVIPKYTLTISATNGHIEDGDGNTLETGAVAQGAEIEITAVPNTGYKFASWDVSGTGSGVEDDDEITTTFTMGSEAATLIANFEARTPITVTWHDGNNGESTRTTDTYTDATFGEANAGELLTPASVNGWTAIGWATSYSSGYPVLVTASTIVGSTTDLYAVYRHGNDVIYQLTTSTSDLSVGTRYMMGYYSSGYLLMTTNFGGTSAVSLDANNKYTYTTGTQWTLGGSNNAWTFTDSNDKLLSSQSTSNNYAYLKLESTATDYSYWSISYDDASPKHSLIQNNGNVTNNSKYLKISYYSNGSIFECQNNAVVYLFKEVTEYSKTPTIELCYVTYDANGATEGDVPTDGTGYNPGASVEVLGNTGSLAKTGHTFNTWNTQADGNGTDRAAGSTFTIAANTTLYAKWAVQSYGYTLTDDAHSLAELEVGGESYSALTIPYGTEVEVVVDVDEGYTYFISVKDENDNDVKVEDDVFTMPASTVTITVTSRLLYKYIQVTNDNQLVAGKHYVIASGTSGNSVKGAGYQKAANRNAVAVEFDNDGKMIENNLLWDFVLSGDATNGWTFYDKYTDGEGFLCAPTTATNSLTLQTTLADNGKWSVSIGTDITDYKATVVAKGGTRKNMRYNSSGSGLFNCYAGSDDQSDIYLFVKYNDDDYEIYSPTPMSGDQTVYSLVVEGTLTIKDGATLEVLDELINDNPANLIIEDGGQLIVNNAGVQATVKKSVDTWSAKAALSGWQTISTSTHDDGKDYVSFANVTNLVYQEASVDKYNVYKFNEPNTMWLNNLNGSNSFSQLDCGHGYLYRTGGLEDIAYTGELNYDDVGVTLSYACENANYKGFNLIGNPFSHSIYKGAAGSAIPNGTLLAAKYYALDKEDGTFKVQNDGTEIPTGTAILVQALDQSELGNDYTLTIANSTSGAAAKDFNGNIWFTVKNSEFSDVACVEFKEGRGLNKMKHYNENAPMLYINHDGESFAAVNFSEDTRAFDLCFKAQSMSRYTLSAKANGNFSYFHLIDRLTGEDVDMLLEGEYSFIANPSDNANRFIVRLSETSNYDDNNESFAFQNGNDIVVTGNGELQIFDVIGRMVMNQHINGVQTVNVNAQGVYIFRLIGNEIQTQKIVVK